MQGVTTALVAFVFFCVIFPDRVKNRTQFYAALGMVCGIILLDALGFMIAAVPFRVFVYFATAVLQIGAILLLFMSAGGLSWMELRGELGSAYEVIRRGGEEKEIIVPLTGEMPKPRERPEPPAERIPIDEPPSS
jgi:hypothetical protein